MAEFPLLELPQPTRKMLKGRRSTMGEKVAALSPAHQIRRLGPKFDRLSQSLNDSKRLAEL